MAYVDLTLKQFQDQFSTEESCLEVIFEARWPRGFMCPHCEHNDGIRLKSRIRVVECSSCHRQTSITSQTLFHRSHLSLVSWFLAIYLFAKDKGGASASRISKQVGMSYPTAWFVLQRLRIAMQTRDEHLTLAGYIELDEAFFGGRTKNPNRKNPPWFDKKTILVMVENEGDHAGNLVMKLVDSPFYEDLVAVVESKVDTETGGQMFRSDGWGSNHVAKIGGSKINMSRIFDQDKELKYLSLAISHAKRFFKGTYHHFCKVHIQRYLDEFCYRWNRRQNFDVLPQKLILASVLHGHVAYASVVAPSLAA